MAQFDFWMDVWPLFGACYEIAKSIITWPFPASKKDISGEVALVTGAGSGLGRGVAYLLAEKGCSVVCWDMNETENEKTVQHIRDNIGQEAYGFKVDVSDRTNVYKAARESEILAGKVTILVNNAGIVGGKDFLELDDKVIQKVIEVNSVSHLWTTKAFLPSMIENDHGHICSIASSAGYFAVPKLAEYCASKAAAAHFADSLETELKKQGSNVNVTWICPYAIHTGMFAGFESRQAWIVDVLQPEYVVKEIVHAIQTNANMVLLPKILNVVLVLQAILPRKASYLLGKWAGIHDCMNNFTGRGPAKKTN